MPGHKRRIAVFGTEPVTGKIGGLGIRQLETARVLSKHFEVKLITPYPVDPHNENFRIERVLYQNRGDVAEAVKWADAIYVNQPAPSVMEYATKLEKPVAVDFLALLYFEELEQLPLESMSPEERATFFSGRVDLMHRQVSCGDFFVCTNERERDYYLGVLTMAGKLRPEEYKKDPTFKSVIDIAPFGLPKKKPPKGKNILRGKIDGVGEKDFLIIWGGSLWNWYDSITPVKAMARLKKTCPRAKLVFIPANHPATKKMPEMYEKTMEIAKRKGLLGKNVFFHSEWVPYEEHGYYLSEADAGIATFPDHLENRYSFRIRIMDYIWGNLPILTNPGNTLSNLVEEHSLGFSVPYGDDKALAEKIKLLASKPATVKKIRNNLETVKKNFHWEKAMQPLVKFFNDPIKVKPVFSDKLSTVTFSDLPDRDLKRVLFLRSSPMEHSAKAVEAIGTVAPESKIDVVLQPGIDPNLLGKNLNSITLPENGFDPKDAPAMANGRGDYDVVIMSINRKELLEYENVISFASKFSSKKYWVFSDEYLFTDITILCKKQI